ncbi:MAG TPA: flagellar hook-length control protein FliK, partial [Spirochaetota bacterium]|nr:flagellar hook-length control protein FliK [Spirochaetota bacterium]
HKKANNNKQTTQNIEQNDKTYHAEKNREMKSSKNNAAHNTKQNKIAQNNSGLGAKNKNNVKVILNDKIVSLQQNKNLAQFTKIHDLNHTQTNTHKLIEKVIQSIKYAVSENTKELNIRLKPDHLGRINIKLKMEDNIMNGKLIVDNNAVKELLESKMQFLKDHLKDQGYNFANIDVDISSEQNSDQQKSMFNIENEKHNSSPGVDLKEKEAADNRLIDLRYNEKQLNLTA